MRKLGLVIGAICLTAGASGQNVIGARPGLINYTEGDVQIDGQPVGPKSNGANLLEAGQVLDTIAGKAEVLLTPGVFLRIGDHSAVRMVSPDLTDTQVELQQGQALVEVTELFKGNRVRILNADSSTELLKKGIYRFDADPVASVSVYDGKARVESGDRTLELKKGKQALLAGSLEAEKFDRKDTGPLYKWSEVRSQYLAEANVASARTVMANRRLWSGPGWYWNPYFSSYSFLPGGGIRYSPFGYGFYSPSMVSYAPVYVYRPFRGASRIPGRALPRPRIERPRIDRPGSPAMRGTPPARTGPPRVSSGREGRGGARR